MSNLETLRMGGWVFYLGDGYRDLDEDICGKWMYFFNDKQFAADICKRAIIEDVCAEAKHSDASEGVCCFYLNGDDIEAHRSVIQFFLDNNLIRRTKSGRLYNISFKYDEQTEAGEYGTEFNGIIKLENFIDLETGKWINKK